MKLAIFGASGVTGRHLLEQALQAGHQVTALKRTPGSLQLQTGLTTVIGSLDQQAAVQSVIQGADAVISVLGMRDKDATPVCTDGARSILEAMASTGVRRLIALSAYGAAETSNASWFIRFVRTVIASKMHDKDNMEALVRSSDSDWTLVRPPMLTNGSRTDHYRASTDLRPGLTGRLSRADLAAFILQEAAAAGYIGQAPVVSV
jgi:putative NADH-flavin reductase